MPASVGNRRNDIARAFANRVRYVTGSVAFNTPGVATGVSIGTIPANSIVSDIVVIVTAVFNAATTNVLQVGRLGTLGAFAGTADVNEASATAQRVTTGLGNVGATDVDVLVSYTQTGTAATTGAATVVITFINPNPDAGGAV